MKLSQSRFARPGLTASGALSYSGDGHGRSGNSASSPPQARPDRRQNPYQQSASLALALRSTAHPFLPEQWLARDSLLPAGGLLTTLNTKETTMAKKARKTVRKTAKKAKAVTKQTKAKTVGRGK